MDKTFLFSIAAALCIVIGVTLATEVNEVRESVSDIERTKYTPVETGVNRDFHFNGSGLQENQAEECKCKNGKCMRVCDRDQTTPCEDQRKVCVCDPMFAKKSDGECEYCDCGEDFNCTFTKNYYDRWQKNCICPKDYYFSNAGMCIAKCNYARYCENGGTCSYGSCSCPHKTEGYFCERIPACSSKCQNRLEMLCSYNRYKLVVECECKDWTLWYDEEADICKPCACGNGRCYYDYGYSDRKLRCSCDIGYKEFNGYCKECQCGPGSDNRCEFDLEGEKICKCLDGFYEREGQCLPCGCMSDSDGDIYTKCEVNGTLKRCFCPELYQDVLGRCEVTQIDPCITNNTCHPTAKCFNVFGKIACRCPEGYKGFNGKEVEPGEVCEDINECLELTNACWYSYRVNCVNLPGSYKCECIRGFEPESYQEQPHKTRCIPTSKNAVPSVIVAFTTLGLIITSCCVHKRVKKRATSWGNL